MKQRGAMRFSQLRTKLWVVWVCLILWWVAVATVQWVRYQHDGYGAIDLSIYTQVLWNILHGHGLLSSVQGHNYFADHVEPMLFVAVPMFRLWASPIMLLWLQTLCIGLAVFPLRRISGYVLGKDWQNIPVFLFLLHTVTWNIALFEFHVYTFALPIFIWVACSYMEQDFERFVLGLSIAALLREDVALVVIFVGVFALLRPRAIVWWLTPMLIGVAGVAIAYVVQTHIPGVSLQGMYYPWFGAFASGHFSEGFNLLMQCLLRLTPYTMILVALLSFGVVVAFGWEWWVPIIPTLVLFALTNRSVESVLVSDHHAAVTTAFFWVALIVGAKRVLLFASTKKMFGLAATVPVALYIVGGLVVLPWAFVWGAREWVTPQLVAEDTSRLEQRIGATDGVLASASLLPHVSTRQVTQWSWYAFKGHDETNQFAYHIDPAVQWVLFDTNEFIDFRSKAEYLPEQEIAFKSIIQENFSLVDSEGPVLLFRRGKMQAGPLLDRLASVISHPQEAPHICDAAQTFSLYDQPSLAGLVLTVRVQVKNPECWKELEDGDNEVPLLNVSGSGQETSVLLAYGFVAPQSLQAGDIVTTTIQVPDRLLASSSSVTVTGTLIHPIGVQLARNQSTARNDIVRSTFLAAAVQAE